MLLCELFDNKVSDFVKSGYQNLNQDNSRASLGSLRRTRLTLAQIKWLRKWSDARNAEHKAKSAFLRNIYKFIPRNEL